MVNFWPTSQPKVFSINHGSAGLFWFRFMGTWHQKVHFWVTYVVWLSSHHATRDQLTIGLWEKHCQTSIGNLTTPTGSLNNKLSRYSPLGIGNPYLLRLVGKGYKSLVILVSNHNKKVRNWKQKGEGLLNRKSGWYWNHHHFQSHFSQIFVGILISKKDVHTPSSLKARGHGQIAGSGGTAAGVVPWMLPFFLDNSVWSAASIFIIFWTNHGSNHLLFRNHQFDSKANGFSISLVTWMVHSNKWISKMLFMAIVGDTNALRDPKGSL